MQEDRNVVLLKGEKIGMTLNELIPIEGLYKDYLIANNKMIAMIVTSGINLGLLDDDAIDKVFENYASLLYGIASEREPIILSSITIPINMKSYDLYWKARYIDIENRTDLDKKIKNNLLNLIASKILDYEDMINDQSINTKLNVIAIKEDLIGRTQEHFDIAEDNLKEKVHEMLEKLRIMYEGYDVENKVCSGTEVLDIIQYFTDNAATTYR